MSTTKTKNLWAKTRPISNPHLKVRFNGWEWLVLKAYQTRKGERATPYARWLCSVSSPFTQGGSDFGDVYIHDIPLSPENRRTLDERELAESKEVTNGQV